MSRVLCLALALQLGGCAPAEPRQIRLELTQHTSCLPVFATQCVQALQVQLVGEERRYAAQCTVLGGQYATLYELITASDRLQVLGDVRLHDGVRVEVRGYHAFDKEACSDLDDDDLMFWGSSAPLDLTDDGLDEVVVGLECRPSCDCAELDPDDPEGCPLKLSPGVCGPPEWLPCSVYGAACTDCSSDADCGGQLCVRHVYSGSERSIDESFCTDPCPPLPDARPCPARMTCRALGGAFERVD